MKKRILCAILCSMLLSGCTFTVGPDGITFGDNKEVEEIVDNLPTIEDTTTTTTRGKVEIPDIFDGKHTTGTTYALPEVTTTKYVAPAVETTTSVYIPNTATTTTTTTAPAVQAGESGVFTHDYHISDICITRLNVPYDSSGCATGYFLSIHPLSGLDIDEVLHALHSEGSGYEIKDGVCYSPLYEVEGGIPMALVETQLVEKLAETMGPTDFDFTADDYRLLWNWRPKVELINDTTLKIKAVREGTQSYNFIAIVDGEICTGVTADIDSLGKMISGTCTLPTSDWEEIEFHIYDDNYEHIYEGTRKYGVFHTKSNK